MIYRLFENITYENGDFERGILREFTEKKQARDVKNGHEGHWKDKREYYPHISDITFDLLGVG